MTKKKDKTGWSVLYNKDKNNLPKQIDLTDVLGDKQSININELVTKKIKDKIEELKKELEKIDFMNYIGKRNPFSNEQLNEQINLGINQKIEEVFALSMEDGK